MKIREQIRARREQLGISVNELAGRVGVSAQSIRHWEGGRSFPGKSKTAIVEQALSFTLDWTEGRKATKEQPQMAALIEQGDIELLLVICRLPPAYKAALGELAKMHLNAVAGGKKAFSGTKIEEPAATFHEREEGAIEDDKSKEISASRPRTRKEAAK